MRARVLTLSRCIASLLILTGGAAAVHAQGTAPILVNTTTLDDPTAPCSGTFTARDLNHVTSVAGPTVDQFEANGAGLGIGDLDNDGDLDIVLGNDAGPNSILWNDGNLSFRVERMWHGDTRAVNLVDVDGDGWLDIVFTRRTGGLTYWRNAGAPGEADRFVRETLPGIARPAYAMAWADLDADGDLDLVTGSYDAGLLSDLGNGFLLNGTGGVTVYENREGRFPRRESGRLSSGHGDPAFRRRPRRPAGHRRWQRLQRTGLPLAAARRWLGAVPLRRHQPQHHEPGRGRHRQRRRAGAVLQRHDALRRQPGHRGSVGTDDDQHG